VSAVRFRLAPPFTLFQKSLI